MPQLERSDQQLQLDQQFQLDDWFILSYIDIISNLFLLCSTLKTSMLAWLRIVGLLWLVRENGIPSPPRKSVREEAMWRWKMEMECNELTIQSDIKLLHHSPLQSQSHTISTRIVNATSFISLSLRADIVPIPSQSDLKKQKNCHKLHLFSDCQDIYHCSTRDFIKMHRVLTSCKNGRFKVQPPITGQSPAPDFGWMKLTHVYISLQQGTRWINKSIYNSNRVTRTSKRPCGGNQILIELWNYEWCKVMKINENNLQWRRLTGANGRQRGKVNSYTDVVMCIRIGWKGVY